MSEDNVSKIKTRIMALLAKARGTDNEHEAEAFLAKAMDMMQQYQLDIADMVDAHDPILQHFGYEAAETGHAWRWNLYGAVALLYGCKTVHSFINPTWNGKRHVYTKRAELVGRESAIITVELMYPWIVEQVRKAAKELAKTSGMSEQGQAKRVAAALILRIHRLVKQNKAEAPATAAGRNALVILDQVEAKFDELYPNLKKARSTKLVTDSASRRAAEGIGLHRQTGRSSNLKIGGR